LGFFLPGTPVLARFRVFASRAAPPRLRQFLHFFSISPGLHYIDAFGSGNISDRPKLAFIEQAGNRACVEGALRAQTMNHTTPSLLKQIGVCSANLNDLVETFADLHKQSPG